MKVSPSSHAYIIHSAVHFAFKRWPTASILLYWTQDTRNSEIDLRGSLQRYYLDLVSMQARKMNSIFSRVRRSFCACSWRNRLDSSHGHQSWLHPISPFIFRRSSTVLRRKIRAFHKMFHYWKFFYAWRFCEHRAAAARQKTL